MKYIVFSEPHCTRCDAIKKKIEAGGHEMTVHRASWHSNPNHVREWRENPLMSYELVAHLARHNNEVPAVYCVDESRWVDNDEFA